MSILSEWRRQGYRFARTICRMTEWRTGSLAELQRLTDSLAVFSLAPEPGTCFPGYEAGQYIALRRERCRLTHLVVDAHGGKHAVAQSNHSRPLFGPVSHPYSITSSPYDAAAGNRLEFLIAKEIDLDGVPGRFTTSLFEMAATGDYSLSYISHMSGTFTLAERRLGSTSVLMVATGTGVAPFISMIRQLNHEARMGKADRVRYTLIYANRTVRELAYHSELLEIEASRRMDFVYIPSVSRPSPSDSVHCRLGQGRASNLLRHLFGMPIAGADGGHPVEPALPPHLSRQGMSARVDGNDTVILTCGNPLAVADVCLVARAKKIRVETEDW
jgi:ferredoxin-NADP reductase